MTFLSCACNYDFDTNTPSRAKCCTRNGIRRSNLETWPALSGNYLGVFLKARKGLIFEECGIWRGWFIYSNTGVIGFLQYLNRPPPPSRKLGRGNVKLDDSIFGHRLLVGSAPPSCQGKCGSCVPCTPIHVSVGSSPVHAGSVVQQEYYPEVWRCKCGNKTFMP